MKGLPSSARQLRERLRGRLAEWEGSFGLDPEERFFEGWEEMPAFRFEPDRDFCPATAWWLAELCRLAYTPDHREVLRDGAGKLPRRDSLLRERSPFVEVLSVRRWGNHASIYRLRDAEGPTVVCFRGTRRIRQWIMNLLVRPHRWRRFRREGDPETAFVHSGFYVLLKRIWPRLEGTLHGLPRPWIFTGHSLGGALATLAGVLEGPDLVATFGSPKVGNEDFSRLRHPNAVWRLVNASDLVPRLPLRDKRLGSRNFTHACESLYLNEEGALGRFESVEVEGLLPVSPAGLSREVAHPPSWIVDHRIGEYCRKLRSMAGQRMAD